MRKKWQKPLIAVAVIVLLTAAGAIYWAKRDRGMPRLIMTDSLQLQTGAQIYKDHCASCHGPNFGGQPN